MLLKDNEHNILLTSVNKYAIVRISRILVSKRVLSLKTAAVVYYKTFRGLVLHNCSALSCCIHKI